MKIVILDGYTENPGDLSWSGIRALGELIVYNRTHLDNEKEIQKRIEEADIVFTNKTPLSSKTIQSAKNLKFIGVLATGYNVVDIQAAKIQGIPVSNIPIYGTEAVAQFAIALLLEICHHIGHHSIAVHEGRWENNKDWCFWDYPLIELSGKTMGIIGFGRIGKTTGKIAKSLGMNIIAYDQFQSDEGKKIASYVNLNTLFKESDVIILHCPLFKETKHMINKNSISKMKDNVIIINNSRGLLIEENDLANALDSGKVFAAGCDVVSTEPIEGNNPLLKAKNCFITPHISWAPKESRERLMNLAIENLQAFINGSPINVVNS